MHGGIEKPGEELPPVMGQAVSFQNISTIKCAICKINLVLVDESGYLLVNIHLLLVLRYF